MANGLSKNIPFNKIILVQILCYCSFLSCDLHFLCKAKKVLLFQKNVCLVISQSNKFTVYHLSPPGVKRPFPSCCEPHYESEAKCKAFHMKISFDCIRMKTNFHTKNFALSLTFIMRLKATRKWPIVQQAILLLKLDYLLQWKLAVTAFYYKTFICLIFSLNNVDPDLESKL